MDKSLECAQAAEMLRARLKEETGVGLLFVVDQVESDPSFLKEKYRVAAYVPVITDLWMDRDYFTKDGLTLPEVLAGVRMDEFILNGIKRVLSTIKELVDDTSRIFPTTTG